MQSIQVAYLSKGLTHLRKLLTTENKDMELELREQIKQHAVQFRDHYDPYSISKVLRYLYTYNDSSDSAIQVYQALGERFLSNL